MKQFYLVVTPFFPSPESWRGAYCYDFVKALMRVGKYDVRVFVPGSGPDYDYQGVHVYRFPVKMLPSNILPFLFTKWNQQSFLNKVKAAGIEFQNVAVCHGHTANFSVYPLAVKRENSKCLTLLHHHDSQSFGLNNSRLSHCWLYNLVQFPILRYFHEQMDGHVFISGSVKRSFLAAPDASWTSFAFYCKQMRGLGWYRPTKIKKAFVLHNGVNTQLFTPATKQASTIFTVGCVGNFSELKDQIGLLKALALIKDLLGAWKLKFVGSGAIEREMRALIATEGMEANVEFISEMDHTQLPDFYRSLDLFVLPSWFEGFGCVFTEASACGVPFITCEGQGMDDLIPDNERHIWLCKQRNPQDLAEKVLHYYQNRPTQHLIGPIDIDVLVRNFVNEIETKRG
jgi:glycosyltransferase involved in cell wall biosynthesis